MSKVGKFKKQPCRFATKSIHVDQEPDNWNDILKYHRHLL